MFAESRARYSPMRPLQFLPLTLVALLATPGCEEEKGGEKTKPEKAPTRAPVDASPTTAALGVPALLEKARSLGEKTWPDAKLTGIRVGLEIPPGSRMNTRAVRVGFAFDTDPIDATAASGSVLCAPECQVLRHQVKGIEHPWPTCEWKRALQHAREAGISADFPLATYGNWSGGDIWVFKNNTNEDKAIAIDGACKVIKR